MSGKILIKRIYNAPSERDGYRVLVDRLWPRGISKENAALDEWMKDIAPSTKLRQWFSHDPDKWDEFCDRYRTELKNKPDLMDHLRQKSGEGTVTLLYGSRETQYNHARLLQTILTSP